MTMPDTHDQKKADLPLSPPAAEATAVTTPTSKAVNLNFILITVFIDMLGIGLIVPVLPILVKEYVSNNEAHAFWYGILAASFGLMQFIFMPLLGALSDRIGRKPVMLFSMAGMCINFLTTAWATSIATLFIGRLIGGMSSASMSVASAYASDVSPPEQRAKSFGKIGAAFGLGFIFGPMLGGVLGSVNLQLPFYVAAALSAANFIYGALFVPESLAQTQRSAFSWEKIKPAFNPFATLWRLMQRKELRGLLYVFILSSFAQMMLQTTWVLYTHFRFHWTSLENGIALFFVGVSAAVVQAGMLSWLIKKMGEMRLALWGLASGAITFVCYGLATEGWMMYVFILCNLLSFAAGPALQSIASKATDPREQGALMGSLQSINSLGSILMPLLGTQILGMVSHLPANDMRLGACYFLCAVMQGLAWWLAVRFFRQRPIGNLEKP